MITRFKVPKLLFSLGLAVLAFWLTKELGFVGGALAGAGHGSGDLGLLFFLQRATAGGMVGYSLGRTSGQPSEACCFGQPKSLSVYPL